MNEINLANIYERDAQREGEGERGNHNSLGFFLHWAGGSNKMLQLATVRDNLCNGSQNAEAKDAACLVGQTQLPKQQHQQQQQQQQTVEHSSIICKKSRWSQRDHFGFRKGIMLWECATILTNATVFLSLSLSVSLFVIDSNPDRVLYVPVEMISLHLLSRLDRSSWRMRLNAVERLCNNWWQQLNWTELTLTKMSARPCLMVDQLINNWSSDHLGAGLFFLDCVKSSSLAH